MEIGQPNVGILGSSLGGLISCYAGRHEVTVVLICCQGGLGIKCGAMLGACLPPFGGTIKISTTPSSTNPHHQHYMCTWTLVTVAPTMTTSNRPSLSGTIWRLWASRKAKICGTTWTREASTMSTTGGRDFGFQWRTCIPPHWHQLIKCNRLQQSVGSLPFLPSFIVLVIVCDWCYFICDGATRTTPRQAHSARRWTTRRAATPSIPSLL